MPVRKRRYGKITVVPPVVFPCRFLHCCNDYKVHVAARVEVLPYAEGGAGGPCTVYVYVGLDCSDKDARSHDLAENGGLTVIDSAGESRKSLLIRGTSEQLGNFEFQAWASRRGEGGSELSIAFVGKANVSMVDVKRELEGMHTQHQRSARRQRQSSDIPATQPFLLPNRADESSNVVLVQVTGQAPFVVDLVVRGGPAQGGASGGEDNGNGLEVSPEIITKWLESGSRNFSDRFRKTFSLEKKGFEPIDVAASKAALSNLLGGMGYFAGNSEVRGAGRNGRNGPSFEANLFTAVPSRSFFPRGFLWDEGFHQVRCGRDGVFLRSGSALVLSRCADGESSFHELAGTAQFFNQHPIAVAFGVDWLVTHFEYSCVFGRSLMMPKWTCCSTKHGRSCFYAEVFVDGHFLSSR